MSFKDFSALKVLVVDDFDSFRNTLARMLSTFGCQTVRMASNGERAVEACIKETFDVVLCDYNLGDGANGQQVLEELRLRHLLPTQSIFLLVSAESGQSIILSAVDYAPDGYVTKPITAKSLQQRLGRLLKQRLEMGGFYESLDLGEKKKAIAIAERAIKNESRYTPQYQKVLGDLYLEMGRIEEAKNTFVKVLEVRPQEWAQVGMAKVRLAAGDVDKAIEWLERILATNPYCLQAYDALAEIYSKENRQQELQDVQQRAVESSPLSLPRQLALAKTADENQDLPVAARAYSKVVRLGANSCQDDPANHLQFARVSAKWVGRTGDDANAELISDGLKALKRLQKNGQLDDDNQIQLHLLQAQLLVAQGSVDQAENLLSNLGDTLLSGDLSAQARIDALAALKKLGREEECDRLIENYLADFKGDQEALALIDPWLDEPVSDASRKMVTKINNQGIGFYQAKNYIKSLECFDYAGRLFPNHPGVKLNLIQALIGCMRSGDAPAGSASRCQGLIKHLSETMQQDHAQFSRFMQLQQMFATLQKEAKLRRHDD